jgi:hypothetical protein
MKEKLWVPNTSTFPLTTLVAEVHLASGQLLFKKQTLSKARSIIYRAGVGRPTIIIQFNSILLYLRAKLTAQRLITMLVQVRKKKRQKTYKIRQLIL